MCNQIPRSVSKADAFWEATFRREGDAASQVTFQLAAHLSAGQVDGGISPRVHIAEPVPIKLIRRREVESREDKSMAGDGECCWNLAHNEESYQQREKWL